MRFDFQFASRRSQFLCALAGLVLTLGLPTLARAQAFQLGVRVDLPMGTYPASVAVADMNGDGIPDLVATNSQDVNLSIWLGLGGGAYAPRVNYATGGNPLFVTVADFNRDGRPDVAASNFDSGTISILLGNGAGGLAPKVDLVAEFRPRSIAVADVNGDNLLDLVVPNFGANNLSVFLGNGNGGFAPRTNIGPFSNPTCITTPDLNADGRPDLVVTNFGGTTISVLLANGSGGFGAKTDYAVGSGSSTPHWVTSGDLNSDGFDDVAVADYGSNQFSIFLGNGTGSLGPKTDFAAATGPISIALADMNADGIADVVTALASGSVSVFAGNGSGGFGTATTVAVGSGTYQATVADLNGDGRPDIVTANQLANSLSVLFGNGTGGFRTKVDYTQGNYPQYAVIRDVNLDGRPDLLTVSGITTTSLSVRLADAAGGLGPKTDFTTALGPVALAVGDVNGDGKPDVATADWDANLVSVFLGNGAGGFGTKTDYSAPNGPTSVALADMNGDGRPDLVVGGQYITVVSISLNNGTGGFGARTDYPLAGGASSIAVTDLNVDGNLDVAAATGPQFQGGGPSQVAVLLGNGAGALAARTDYTTGEGPTSVAVGDLNGDGLPDLAVANAFPSSVSVLLCTGGGAFGAKTDFTVGANPEGVAIGDINGDGRLDVASANYGTTTTSVLLGNGAGGFGPRTDYAVGTSPYSVAIGDLNLDGRSDLATANFYSANASVVLGLTPTRTALAASPNPALQGAAIILTATVSVPAPGFGVPTGTVRFFDGTRLLGTSPVTGGVAALVLFSTRLGSRVLSAIFSGDGKFFGSISPSVTQQVVSTATAQITGVVDVPNDQGYQVRMTFNASPFDYLGSPTPISNYLLYRKIDPAPMAKAIATRSAVPSAVALAGWDFLMTVPATADKVYEVVVPTLINGAGNLSTFFVRATLSTPGLFYDSPQAQGYSLDNLPPGPPAPFVGNYSGGAAHLSWGENLEPDLAQYRLYRGSSAGFVPGPGNLVTVTAGTTYDDVGPAGSYYKLSATDVNGNESAYALLTPGGTTGVDDGPVAFALGRLANPVVGGRLTVSFALPSAERATLEMVDVSGRAVARQDVGALGVGRHAVTLGDGTPLPAGMYFVRLTQGRQGAMARVTVLR